MSSLLLAGDCYELLSRFSSYHPWATSFSPQAAHSQLRATSSYAKFSVTPISKLVSTQHSAVSAYCLHLSTN